MESLPRDLLSVFAALDTPEAFEKLLGDLLSPAEMRSVGERWAIVRALAEGKTQREVRDEVGAAIATVSRGAQQLRNGSGGFDLAFRTLEDLGLPRPRKEEGAS